MNEPETFILKRIRETFDGLVGYSSPGVGVTVFLHRVHPPEAIEVTIKPQAPEQETQVSDGQRR